MQTPASLRKRTTWMDWLIYMVDIYPLKKNENKITQVREKYLKNTYIARLTPSTGYVNSIFFLNFFVYFVLNFAFTVKKFTSRIFGVQEVTDRDRLHYTKQTLAVKQWMLSKDVYINIYASITCSGDESVFLPKWQNLGWDRIMPYTLRRYWIFFYKFINVSLSFSLHFFSFILLASFLLSIFIIFFTFHCHSSMVLWRFFAF